MNARPRAPRSCSMPGCDRPARNRGRTCGRCATRAWRDRHPNTIAARERARTFTPEQQALRRASAIFFTHLRRRNLPREPCAHCGRSEVVPHWPDVSKPLEVVWFCRDHRAIERDLLAEEAAASAKAVAWTSLRERFDLEWPVLAPDLQARLRAEADRASMFRNMPAHPESPMYYQQLVAAFARYCATLEPASSGKPPVTLPRPASGDLLRQEAGGSAQLRRDDDGRQSGRAMERRQRPNVGTPDNGGGDDDVDDAIRAQIERAIQDLERAEAAAEEANARVAQVLRRRFGPRLPDIPLRFRL